MSVVLEHITAIDLQQVTRRFGTRGLGPVDLSLEKGNCCAVIGANGSGKTTLLRCLSLLEPLDSGAVHIGDCTWSEKTHASIELRTKLAKTLGFVFQNPEPWPHLTVMENLTLPLVKILGLHKREAEANAELVLERFGLSGRADEMPNHLSGGLRQRVAMARTVAMQPDVLVLDEPTSALDPMWTEWMADFVNSYKADNKTVLVVSHQMGFVRRVADKVIYMEDGLIKECGGVMPMLDSPVDPGLQRFLMNI